VIIGPSIWLITLTRYGIVCPPGMDAAIAAKLHDAFKATLEDPRVLQTLDKFDQPVLYMNGGQYLEYAKREVDNDKEVVKQLKLSVS
jgi:tripartite-type tricarboxylate transporter receptor subunit TctC